MKKLFLSIFVLPSLLLAASGDVRMSYDPGTGIYQTVTLSGTTPITLNSGSAPSASGVTGSGNIVLSTGGNVNSPVIGGTVSGTGIGVSSSSNLFLMSTFHSSEDKLYFYTANAAGGPFLPVGDPIYTAPSGGVRDPGFFYNQNYGQQYYIAYTAGAFGGTNTAKIIRSNDLQNWSQYANISTASLGAVTQTWVNGFCPDGDIVYAPLSVSTDNLSTMNMYLSQSTISGTMATWSAPVAITNTGTWPARAIALNIVNSSGTNFFYFKDDINNRNMVATSTSGSPYGPYTTSGSVSPTGYEGFTIALTGTGPYVNSGTYTALIDKFSNNQGIYAVTSTNLLTLSAPVAVDSTFGSMNNPFVFKVPDAKMATDVANLVARHASRSAAFSGLTRPTGAANTLPGYWLGNYTPRVGVLFQSIGGFEGLNLYVNAYNNGSNDRSLDTTLPSWLYTMSYGASTDNMVIYRSGTNSGNLTFTQLLLLSNAGKMTLAGGMVTTTGTFSTSITTPTVSITGTSITIGGTTAAPSGTASPVTWFNGVISGTTFKIPLYQ
jgi:hypothetical protein